MIIENLIINLDHNKLIKTVQIYNKTCLWVVYYLLNLHNSNVSWWRTTQTCWWEVRNTTERNSVTPSDLQKCSWCLSWWAELTFRDASSLKISCGFLKVTRKLRTHIQYSNSQAKTSYKVNRLNDILKMAILNKSFNESDVAQGAESNRPFAAIQWFYRFVYRFYTVILLWWRSAVWLNRQQQKNINKYKYLFKS